MKKRLYLYFHRRTHSVLLARVLGEAAYAAAPVKPHEAPGRVNY